MAFSSTPTLNFLKRMRSIQSRETPRNVRNRYQQNNGFPQFSAVTGGLDISSYTSTVLLQCSRPSETDKIRANGFSFARFHFVRESNDTFTLRLLPRGTTKERVTSADISRTGGGQDEKEESEDSPVPSARHHRYTHSKVCALRPPRTVNPILRFLSSASFRSS